MALAPHRVRQGAARPSCPVPDSTSPRFARDDWAVAPDRSTRAARSREHVSTGATAPLAGTARPKRRADDEPRMDAPSHRHPPSTHAAARRRLPPASPRRTGAGCANLGGLWIADFRAWPDEARGKRVRAVGTLIFRDDLPVFPRETYDSGGPVPAGIGVPEGADLVKSRRRYLLEKVEWSRRDP